MWAAGDGRVSLGVGLCTGKDCSKPVLSCCCFCSGVAGAIADGLPCLLFHQAAGQLESPLCSPTCTDGQVCGDAGACVTIDSQTQGGISAATRAVHAHTAAAAMIALSAAAALVAL